MSRNLLHVCATFPVLSVCCQIILFNEWLSRVAINAKELLFIHFCVCKQDFWCRLISEIKDSWIQMLYSAPFWPSYKLSHCDVMVIKFKNTKSVGVLQRISSSMVVDCWYEHGLKCLIFSLNLHRLCVIAAAKSSQSKWRILSSKCKFYSSIKKVVWFVSMFNGQLLWTWIASLPENKIIISFFCVCIHWYGYEKVDWFIFLSRNVSKWLILYKYIYIFIKKHRREQRETWIFFNSPILLNTAYLYQLQNNTYMS